MTRKLVALLFLVCLSGVMFRVTSQSSSSLTNRASEVKFFTPEQVAASFQKSDTLLQSPDYRVMTAKRDEAGQVEVHTKFLDVFYVLEGNATITVGGKMEGQTSSDPDEPRGTTIQGGEVHELSPGSVVVIPAGIPHWMSKVPGTFRYFVVKVATTAK